MEKVMAYSPNIMNLPRRRALLTFFAGVAAADGVFRVAATTSAATPHGAEPDAQLFARWHEYLKSESELNAVENARDLISWNARQAYPPKPECMASDWRMISPSAIDADVEGWPATMDMKSGGQPAAERMAAVEDWLEQCKEIDNRFGLPELESAFKTAWDRQWAAFARFVATPATTLAGLAVRTSAIFYFEDETRRAWRSMITDQKQLEPEQQILLTLRRDLLRMAGLPGDFAMADAEADEQYVAAIEGHEP
jgi:hypothetical protein